MKKWIIILSSLILILGCYSIYDSYYHVDIDEYIIESEKINEEVTIAMICDMHDFHLKVDDLVIENLSSLNPDIILCVGDMIDEKSKDDSSMLAFLSKLKNIAPVYFSLGNHEYTYMEKHNDLLLHIEDMGIRVLEEDYVDLNINNQNIRLGGMYNYAFDTYDGFITQEAMKNSTTYQFLNAFIQTDDFKIMMAHRPDSFIYGDSYQWNIDAVVSGHVHGGQVVLPLIGGLYAPEQGWFPKCDFGHYTYTNSTINHIISRGLSSSDELLPRMNNPSQIVSIKLQ